MNELASYDAGLERLIIDLVEAGNALDMARPMTALEFYEQAWDALPHPKNEWEMLSSWVSECIFAVHFDLGEFAKARSWAQISLAPQGSDIDVSQLMNLAMATWEVGVHDDALDLFDQAYAMGGHRPFRERPHKYWQLYKKARGK